MLARTAVRIADIQLLSRAMLAFGLAMCAAGLERPARAHEDHDQPRQRIEKVDDKAIYKPTPLPDRIVLTWAGDPAHSQAVTWRTDTSVRIGVAEIAPAEAGPHFVAQARQVAAQRELLTSDNGRAHYHSVNFVDLKPNTRYAYRVGDTLNWTEWFQFTTASERAAPFSFIYFGDAQNDIRAHWSRVIREAIRDAPKARFMIHAGDLVNHGNVDTEWGQWFGAGGWLNAMIPNVPAPGNHEYPRIDQQDDDSERALARNWRPQFLLPANGPAGLEDTVYWVDFQGMRVIALNSNEDQARQVEWLDKTLAENPNRWTVVAFHHPIYSNAPDRDNPELRRLWKPLFDKYRVDLVLQGHDHSYSRTGLDVPEDIVGTENVPTGAAAKSAEGGTVYVVSVSGPKLYDVQRRPFMRRAGEAIQLYQVIHVDGDRLRYEARTAIGDIYDAFTLQKRQGQKNELIEQIPNTPESLPKPERAAAAQ
jgi:3',5'-cyclic AMP phosphodiesterase CpdA